MFRATGFEFVAKTVEFSMKYIVIMKMFYRVSFPPENQQKLYHVYVLPCIAQYMKVACWFFGGNDTLEPKNQSPNMKNGYSYSFRQSLHI